MSICLKLFTGQYVLVATPHRRRPEAPLTSGWSVLHHECNQQGGVTGQQRQSQSEYTSMVVKRKEMIASFRWPRRSANGWRSTCIVSSSSSSSY